MEKGVGGLPIWRAGRADCADFVAIWRAGRADCADSVAIWRAGRADCADLERCLCRVLSISARRFGRVDSVASIRSRRFSRDLARRSCRFGALLVSRRVETRGANTKKARFLNRGIGFSYRKASRALNLL